MPSDYISNALRKIIATRAHNRCEYCQCSADFATETFSVEHILPRSRGGGNTLENLAWSCMGCNSYKAAKIQATDPLTDELALIFHPRQQIWLEHFAWSLDFSEVIGLTPTGRASIPALKLNRDGVVNLRRLLSQAGKHPP
jgi:hypothetical protein